MFKDWGCHFPNVIHRHKLSDHIFNDFPTSHHFIINIIGYPWGLKFTHIFPPSLRKKKHLLRTRLLGATLVHKETLYALDGLTPPYVAFYLIQKFSYYMSQIRHIKTFQQMVSL